MTKFEMPRGDLQRVLLEEVGETALHALFAGARPVRYSAGETVFSEGDKGEFVLLIDEGRIEISTMSITGRKSVLAHMGAGGLLGEIAVLDGGRRSADAVAATDVSGRVLGRQTLIDFISRTPAVAKAVIVELCLKARNASDMFVTQAMPEAGVRLARALLRLFEGWGSVEPDGAVLLTEKFSQQDLGEFCGLARENVNRQIKIWTQAGILEIRGRQLVLRDRGGLQGVAEAETF